MDAQSSTFEEFYRRTWPVSFRVAFLIAGEAETARDLTQEAFERTFSHWRNVSAMAQPDAWVNRVVANLALSWWRRQRLARSRVLPVPSESPDAAREVVPMVVTALRALPPQQRAVVVLRYYADFSIEETARSLGKRPATVRSLAAQGITRLRAILSEEEVRDG